MHIPTSTYRLQLNSQFKFADVEGILPYLIKLGITDIYSSPITQAQPNSSHGYDVTDFKEVNEDLGGYKGLIALSHKLQENNLGLCIDIVPNHMSASEHNCYWSDVLSKRKNSASAHFFDIDWVNCESQKDIHYRRFFDVNELVCLKAEDEQVFKETHQLILDLIHDNKIQGLRIDHIDGLRDPANYFKRLTTCIGKPFFIVVEKILGFTEELPRSWPIQGTTGYEFLNHVNQIYINQSGLDKLITQYNQLTSINKNVREILTDNMLLVINKLFSREFDKLTASLKIMLANEDEEIRAILQQFAANMTVYRTYITDKPTENEIKRVNQVAEKIKSSKPYLVEQIKQIILLQFPENISQEQKDKQQQWLCDWQVFTGPLMAKGFEDTTCYSYTPFLSLNEVGSSPERFYAGDNSADFHCFNQKRQKHWPHTLNTTSTHDTKRSEDARARLNVLTELNQEWNDLIKHWIEHNETKKTTIDQNKAPDIIDEVTLYQSLLSIWPLTNQLNADFEGRMQNFLTKAMRERKHHSSWYAPNDNYEHATQNFFKALMQDDAFIKEFVAFQQKIAFYGAYNSLSQLVLKMTCPGIPDFYQGSETWRFDLVDPDNRQAVHYSTLIPLLNDRPLPELLAYWQDGRIKANTMARVLALRNQYPAIFAHGEYLPLKVTGQKSNHVIAFARVTDDEAIIVIALRWFTPLIHLEEEWSGHIFSDELIHLPFEKELLGLALLNNQTIKLPNNTLKLSEALIALPFELIHTHLSRLGNR